MMCTVFHRVFFVHSCVRETDRQTDRQTDRALTPGSCLIPLSFSRHTPEREMFRSVAETTWFVMVSMVTLRGSRFRPTRRSVVFSHRVLTPANIFIEQLVLHNANSPSSNTRSWNTQTTAGHMNFIFGCRTETKLLKAILGTCNGENANLHKN